MSGNDDIPYIPCTAHRINRSVEHSCDASTPVCALFDILQELFVFITSIRAVWSSYAVILEVLDVLSDSKYDMKTRVKAAALQDKMKSFNFVVMLMFM